MDDETLKARSVELAERANRLKEKAGDGYVREKFDSAADTLIQINNPDRFYFAQSKLEKDTTWTEEMRSLAHEIDLADKTIRNEELLTFDETIHAIAEWNMSYLASTRPEIHATGISINNAIKALSENQSEASIKVSLNYLMSFLETVLAHIQSKDKSENKVEGLNKMVFVLRNVRNALLVKRELSVDEDKLLEENEKENINTDRVELARDSLDEIYSTLKPVDLPK